LDFVLEQLVIVRRHEAGKGTIRPLPLFRLQYNIVLWTGLCEQECAEVFEESFKDFPLTHVLFHKLDRGKSGSMDKLCQEFLTEFPLDKKRPTFEFLVHTIYSTQPMSFNTVNEYTSYLSNVDEVIETLGQVTFNVKEVMFLMEMTNFHQSDTKVHGRDA
jgi:hypothetical protein